MEFSERRKVLSVEEGNCIVKLIKDAFGSEGEILLQKFDTGKNSSILIRMLL